MLSNSDEEFMNMINDRCEHVVLNPSMEFDDENHVLIYSIIYAECVQQKKSISGALARFEYVYDHYHALVVQTVTCARPCLETQTCMEQKQWEEQTETVVVAIANLPEQDQYISKFMDIVDLTIIPDCMVVSKGPAINIIDLTHE